ncbi:MAG: Coenzyme F420 hydrogenase/dehydrogenase, beta subunit C-terminal domain [Candidatus Asgardarchaeia archaeon]
MSKAIRLKVENQDPVEAINSFLKKLLEVNAVDILIAPMDAYDGKSVFPTMFSDPNEINGKVNPLAPVLSVSYATTVSKMTRLRPFSKKVAVVMKPCDIRTLIELVKLKQASLENLIIIGTDCLGTVSIKDFKKATYANSRELTLEMISASFNGGFDENRLRSACRVCEFPVPNKYADIEIQLYGVNPKEEVYIVAKTEKGEKLLDASGFEIVEPPSNRKEAVERLVEERIKKRDEFFERTKKEIHGVEGLKKMFSTCINCHNCMTACPICACKECFFNSSTFEYGSLKYEMWAENRGVFMLPNDKIMFHLGRLSHIATSCTGCGLCEQACPVDIPLLKLFKTVGYEVQKLFNYEPGRDLEEPLPLTTFKEAELENFVGSGEE